MVHAEGARALDSLILRDKRIILTFLDAFRWPGLLLSYLPLGPVASRGGRGANGLVV